MALSGNQKTGIGILGFVGRARNVILPKLPADVTTTVLNFGRGIMRGINRGLMR